MIQDYSKSKVRYKKTNRVLKIAIVRSNYHQNLTESLEKACRQNLIFSGVKEENIKSFEVPGSWEIPVLIKKIAVSKKFDGIIAFGIIVKGETYHFEMIANQCGRALMNISLEFNIPVTFEVLAVYTLEQAVKRSTGKLNKGIEAARTLLETIKELKRI